MDINPRTGIPRGLELPQYLNALARYRSGNPIIDEPKRKRNAEVERRSALKHAYKDGRKCECGKAICNSARMCKKCWAKIREQKRREAAQDKTLGMFEDLPNRVADFVRSLTND